VAKFPKIFRKSEKNLFNKTEGGSGCRRQRCIGPKMAIKASRIDAPLTSILSPQEARRQNASAR